MYLNAPWDIRFTDREGLKSAVTDTKETANTNPASIIGLGTRLWGARIVPVQLQQQ